MKSNWKYAVFSVKKSKTFKSMRFFLIFCFFCIPGVMANGYSQEQIVSLNLKQCDVNTLCQEIWKQTGLRFIYNEEHVKALQVFDVQVDHKTVQEVLDEVFKNTSLRYFFENDIIYIVNNQKDEPDKKEGRSISGTVKDTRKSPLPGVTVLIKGTTVGVVTDIDGKFKIELPKRDTMILIFSFVGMKSHELDVNKIKDLGKEISIKMFPDTEDLEEVVVTGYANVKKESFTGSSISVKREDLLKASATNVVQALASFDPSFRIQQNNKWGSDPNAIPEIYIRGRSGIGVKQLDQDALSKSALKNNPNLPTFIMDGFEVDLERVMDLNQNDIESITILKDASATSLYGSRGANGVIVITTTLANAGALTVSYEGRLNLQIPDLGTYDNLMTASEKFEMEKIYGVWDRLESYLPNGQSYQDAYNEIEDAIAKGVNYNWLKVPTRTGVGQFHSLRFMGSQENWNYMLSLSYDDTKGVMKESERKNFNGTMQLGYRKDKWNVRQSLAVGFNRNQNSPYGEFSSYVQMNRYWVPYEKDGKPVEEYYHPSSSYGPIENPLYDHTVGVWNKTKYTNLRSNTAVDFTINEHLKAQATFGLNYKNTRYDGFTPPEHKDFQYITEIERKGSFGRREGEETMWQIRLMLNYNNIFSEKHMITLGLNGELSETIADDVNWSATGYISSNVSHPGMSMSYPSSGGTNGSESTVRRASLIATANYYYDQRYFVDFSVNYNGGSSFGKNNRFQYFYSLGAGWAVSNEMFVKEHLPFVNEMRFRYSFGVTGNMFVGPEVSMEVFQRNSSYVYLGGIAWTLGQFANPNLEQQNTFQHMTYTAHHSRRVRGRYHMPAS